jgi:hypothetical protein
MAFPRNRVWNSPLEPGDLAGIIGGKIKDVQ